MLDCLPGTVCVTGDESLSAAVFTGQLSRAPFLWLPGECGTRACICITEQLLAMPNLLVKKNKIYIMSYSVKG